MQMKLNAADAKHDGIIHHGLITVVRSRLAVVFQLLCSMITRTVQFDDQMRTSTSTNIIRRRKEITYSVDYYWTQAAFGDRSVPPPILTSQQSGAKRVPFSSDSIRDQTVTNTNICGTDSDTSD